jgi:hypothetical protein
MLFKRNVQQPAIPLTGRNIAQAHRTPSQLAGLAGQWVLGEAAVAPPTIKQAARLFQVCVPYVNEALELTADQRADLVAGCLTVRFLRNWPDRTICWSSPPDLLVSTWGLAGDAERIEFARRVGVDRIFDAAIAPVIG